ncbi:MAG: LysR family transcriptional regulator [Geminicoccaceae bacterium]|nr:LysR family transcriptional regulator [Geminicoccaceae bacterium]
MRESGTAIEIEEAGPEADRPAGEARAGAVERLAEARGQALAVTLHQLRLFWTLAHARSLTQAAKQLGISQPALSQALAKLERLLGHRLVDRQSTKLELTDAGRFLLERAGRLLAEADALESGLAAYKAGLRGRVAVGALASIARTLVPVAYAEALRRVPELALDVHEVAPQEAIEGLYGRTLEVAIVSETAVASDHLPFTRLPVREDGYALAVPTWLVLDGVVEPERELDPRARAVLWSCAAAIALSRIVVGAHYPSDVLAGAVVGGLGALLVRAWFAQRRLVFAMDRDGRIRPMPGPSVRRLKALARRVAGQ